MKQSNMSEIFFFLNSAVINFEIDVIRNGIVHKFVLFCFLHLQHKKCNVSNHKRQRARPWKVLCPQAGCPFLTMGRAPIQTEIGFATMHIWKRPSCKAQVFSRAALTGEEVA
jgi:hypothetical protein